MDTEKELKIGDTFKLDLGEYKVEYFDGVEVIAMCSQGGLTSFGIQEFKNSLMSN